MKGSLLQTNINDTRKIDLKYNQNSFSISFSAINFAVPHRIRYEYFDCKLSGADAWYIDAAPSESMPYSEMICISGVYTDPENSEDSFVYTVYLRTAVLLRAG